MLEFGDVVYFIDLKAFDTAITINKGGEGVTVKENEVKVTYDKDGEIITRETFERVLPQGKELDPAKYDLLKTFVEYIIDYSEETDDALGADRALDQTPLGYKIVFNTLMKEGIIKEKK